MGQILPTDRPRKYSCLPLKIFCFICAVFEELSGLKEPILNINNFEMRTLICCIAFLISIPVFSQSKKELQAQVTQLLKEADQLKTEAQLLKNPKPIELNDTIKQVSYGLGTLVASQLKSQGGDSLNIDAMVEGLKDVMKGKEPRLKQEEAIAVVQAYMQKAVEEKAAKTKVANAKFLEENKKVAGVQTTKSGLQYKVINTGKGKTPAATDKVTVHYTGMLIDGTTFDSSVGREPITFEVGGVIAGWTEALQLMHEGDKWMIYLPYDIAYGERGAGDQIPPYATLIFEVELIKVN
jgi:FKBP-type peptidyl-prolyl cis-trans isomerase